MSPVKYVTSHISHKRMIKT